MEEDQESKSKDTPQRGGGVAARFHAAVAAQNAKHEQRVQGLKAGHALSPGHHITSPIAKDEASVSTPVSRGEYTKRFKESQTSAQKKHLDTTAALREQRLTDFKDTTAGRISIGAMKGKYDVPFFQNNEQNADLIKRVKAKAQELVSTEGESKEEATDSGLMGSRLVEAEEVVTFVVPTARVPILGDLVQDGEMCLLDVGIFGEVGVLPPYRVAAVALELHGEVNIAAIFCANKDSRLNDNTYGIQTVTFYAPVDREDAPITSKNIGDTVLEKAVDIVPAGGWSQFFKEKDDIKKKKKEAAAARRASGDVVAFKGVRKASESVIDVKVDLTAKRESWAAKSKDGDGALPEVPSTGYTGPGSGTIGSEDAVGADVTDMPPIAPDDASETETEDSRRLSSVTAKMADLLNSSADADGNDEGTVEGDAAAQGGETSVPGTEKHTDSQADDGCRGKNEDGNGEEEEEKEEEEGEGENDGESSEQEGEDEEDDDEEEEEEEEEEEDLAELNEETKEALNQETETEKRERQKAELLVAFKAAMADPTKPQVWEKLELNQEILFVPGYSRLAEESFPLLDRVAAFLRKVSAPVRIEGHINTVKDNGTILRSDDPKILVYEDNCTGLQLSERRAAAVSAYLNHRGVPKNFLVPIGCGGERPLTTEKSLLQTNRRVEIHFLRTDLM